MNKTGLIVFGATALLAAFADARAGGEANETDLYGALAGDYDLVGRRPDSEETYSGRVTFTPVDGGLVVTRTVDGENETGRAHIEYRTADKRPVLMIAFDEDGGAWESWCLYRFDLDNDARLTCLWRFAGTEPEHPGLEALFFHPGPR